MCGLFEAGGIGWACLAPYRICTLLLRRSHRPLSDLLTASGQVFDALGIFRPDVIANTKTRPENIGLVYFYLKI